MTQSFRDARLLRLYSYWQERRAGRPAPQRTDIDTDAIADLMPILNIIDVSWEPLRFRHRLVGAELVERLGRNARGQDVGEGLYGPAAAEIHQTLTTLATEIRPYLRRARLDWNGRKWLSMESVELPLIDEDGRVNMILRGSSFFMADVSPERLEFVPLVLE